jgi:hypothetical protein
MCWNTHAGGQKSTISVTMTGCIDSETSPWTLSDVNTPSDGGKCHIPFLVTRMETGSSPANQRRTSS